MNWPTLEPRTVGQTRPLALFARQHGGRCGGLLDALGVEKAHVGGASTGGTIAQLLAINHPSKTKSRVSPIFYSAIS